MYAFCQDMPGMTLQEQTEFASTIDLDAVSGCLVHLVGPVDGGIRMIDVWESEGAYRQFQQTVLWPALQRWQAQRPLDDTQTQAPFAVLEVTGDGYRAGVRA